MIIDNCMTSIAKPEQLISDILQILETLSVALTAQLGKGFSYANLRNFRQFYLTYPDSTNCYALRSNLTWTHHRLIIEN